MSRGILKGQPGTVVSEEGRILIHLDGLQGVYVQTAKRLTQPAKSAPQDAP